MAAIPAIVIDPFEFLVRPCGPNSVSLSDDSGFCATCPTMYPTLQDAQNAADSDFQKLPGNYSRNRSKLYCGNNPIIKKWTLYYQCYGKPSQAQHGFRNPFQYAGLGNPSYCFNNGRVVGNIQSGRSRPNDNDRKNNNNNNPRPAPSSSLSVDQKVPDEDQFDMDMEQKHSIPQPPLTRQPPPESSINDRKVRKRPRRTEPLQQVDDRFDFKTDEDAVHEDFVRRAGLNLFQQRYGSRGRLSNQEYANLREEYFTTLQQRYNNMSAAEVKQLVTNAGLLYTNKFNGIRELSHLEVSRRYPLRN